MRFTVSLPNDLGYVLNDLCERWKTGRSGAIARLLQEFVRREREELMAEGYRELAAETLKEVEDAFHAQAEVVLGEPAVPR